MAETKKIKILRSVGDPNHRPKEGESHGILRAGATVTLPVNIADGLINNGDAEEVAPKAKTEDVVIDEKKAKK